METIRKVALITGASRGIGFDALMEDKDHVVGGRFMNKVQLSGAKFMTEPQRASAQGKSAKPESFTNEN